jgi:hypothetical protein
VLVLAPAGLWMMYYGYCRYLPRALRTQLG